jgi:Tol biopolymer transport system component
MARLGVALILLALALIGASLLAVGAGRLFSTGAVTNGLIAYDSNGDIMVANRDGTNLRVLIGGPTMQVGASWSPDGRTLAYFERVVGDGDYSESVDQFEVHVVDAEGRDDIDLTAGQPLLLQPAGGFWGLQWSHDSRRIALPSRIVTRTLVCPGR